MRLAGLMLRPKHGRNVTGVVVGHEFTNHVRKPFVFRVLERLARQHTVIAFDFRGHGRSGGRCTAGPAKVLDLDAAVHTARQHAGHVATLGFSMHAATGTHRPDAVVAVSATSRGCTRETEAMRRLFWLAELPHGRALIRALRVRMAPPTEIIPPSPVEVVDRIAPTPVLLVHGTEDHYVPVDHALAPHRASGAELWALDGMRHAETAMSPELVDRISDWLHTNTRERLAV